MRLLPVPWMVYLISLALPLQTKGSKTADPNGDLRLLLRKKGDSFRMVSLATNQSVHLLNLKPEAYLDFTLSPYGNEVFFIMSNTTSRHIAKFTSGELHPLHLDLALGDCWHRLKQEKSEIWDIELDFIVDNLYLSTTCGEIYACNLNSLKCSEIYKLRALSNIDLVVYPEKGLLLWAEYLIERQAEDEVHIIQDSISIYRANLDGSSISLVMNAFHGLHYCVLDRQRARIYMEFEDKDGLYFFDILKGHQPLPVPAFSFPELLDDKILLYASGDIFFWLVGSRNISEVTVSDDMERLGNFSVLFQREKDENHVRILPQEASSAEDHGRSNPCLAKNCSHVCALSGPAGGSCLCGRNEDLFPDQVTCMERFLLASTLDGVYRLGLDGQSPVEPWDLLNGSAPELIVHDPVNGELYWAEQDAGKGAAEIYRYEAVSGKKFLALEVKFNESRAGPQAIQAMDVDWLTRNIYFTIQHEERIRVCDSNSNLCTEMFNDFVSKTVCNLELVPQIRKLFWVDVSVGKDSMANVFLNTAGMDGEDEKAIESYVTTALTSCPCMTVDKANLSIYMALAEPFGVYRVDTFDLQGHKYRTAYLQNRKYLPSHIYVSGGGLIWVGRPSHPTGASENETDVIHIARLKYDEIQRIFVHEDYESWNLPHVTALTLYGFASNPMNSSLKEQIRESHLCQGIRLASKNGSFSCACPGGTTRSIDGRSCHRPEHVMIYGTGKGQVFLKNDSGTTTVPLKTSLFTVAQTAKENQLLWTNSSGNIYGGVLSVADPAPLLPVKELVRISKLFTPKQIEYDWVGDNIFALEGQGNIWACGRVSGACAIIVRQTKPLNGKVRFVLDPKRGFLYRTVEGDKEIHRTDMDGTGTTSGTGFSFVIHTMTVDQDDGMMYFTGKGNSRRLGELHPLSDNRIAYCRFGADRHTALIFLSDMPEQIRAVDGYVFWYTWSASKNTWSIFSCERRSGNGLEQHASKAIVPWGRIVHLDVLFQQHPEHSNVCGGGLCSHICIPTIRGYMRCICPVGFELQSDGWTCECVNADGCDPAHEHQQQRQKKKLPISSELVVTSLRGHCGQGQYQCLSSKECIRMDQVCDGHGDCEDVSDEDPRCNDACVTHRCSGNCTSSPVGPFCTCPIGQELADDLRNCASKQDTPKPGTANPVSVFAPVFGTLAAILAVICLVLAWKYLQAKRKLRDLTEDEIREFMNGDSSAASLAPNGMDRAMMLPYKAILPPDGIAVDEKVLGSGEYGVVHSGLYNGQAVAIKKLKHRVDVEEFKAVLAEMKIMSYLGDHENIVKFFGSDVSQIASCQITIVTELSPHGDLLHYLWKVGSEGLKVPQNSVRLQKPEQSTVSVITLNQWCEQIASGMEYLVTKQVIHGDLAARNVLVFNANVIKIADFGMSKQLYGSGQYKMKNPKKLPWKWGSIELLTFGEFSEESDVWAFAVTAWEIFSLGETPYKKIMRFDTQFIEYLREGNRLPQPEHASRATFALMLECWNAEARDRPNFALLREFFHEQVHNMIQREEMAIASAEDSKPSPFYVCI